MTFADFAIMFISIMFGVFIFYVMLDWRTLHMKNKYLRKSIRETSGALELEGDTLEFCDALMSIPGIKVSHDTSLSSDKIIFSKYVGEGYSIRVSFTDNSRVYPAVRKKMFLWLAENSVEVNKI